VKNNICTAESDPLPQPTSGLAHVKKCTPAISHGSPKKHKFDVFVFGRGMTRSLTAAEDEKNKPKKNTQIRRLKGKKMVSFLLSSCSVSDSA